MSTAVSPQVASTAPAAARLSRRRRILVWTMLVVASLLMFASILTLFVDRQMLDNNEWRNASTKVIQDPQIRAGLATYLVNQLYTSVDVPAELEQQLPATLKPLAPQIAASLRRPAESAAAAVLARPRVQQLFVNASGVAHEKLVNVLENKTGFGITTGSGVVTLNVKELLQQVTATLGLPGKLVNRIPPDKQQLVLLRSDQLSTAQKSVQLLHALSAWLLILVLALYAGAIYLARGERRVFLLRTGWAFVVVGLLVVIIRKRLGNYAVDRLSSEDYKATVHHAWLIGTQILGQIGWATFSYGVVLVLAAVFAGPSRAAYAGRRVIAPYLNGYPWHAAAAALGVYLLVLFWGPTHALRMWWGALALGLLLIAAFLALRRQTQAEFPATAA
jgi:hypothetical protein